MTSVPSTPPARGETTKACPPTPYWPSNLEHPMETRRRSSRLAGAGGASPKVKEPTTPTFSEQSTPPPTIKSNKISRNLFGTSATAGSSTSTSSLFGQHASLVQTPKKKKPAVALSTPNSISRSAKTASRLSTFDLKRSDVPIAIFEDTKERLPVPIDDEEDNIFKSSNRTSKRRKTTPEPALGDDETLKNGMWVVQRGRKIFKSFDETTPFDNEMPRKRLFAEETVQPIDTDDEETEREDSVEPPSRTVRFFEEQSVKITEQVTRTPGKATAKTQNKAIRTPKSHIQIETSFLTPPATIQRDDSNTSFNESSESLGRSSVKRKLSYTGPSTPEATPAKKRGKIANGPRQDADVFQSSPGRGRRAVKTRG